MPKNEARLLAPSERRQLTLCRWLWDEPAEGAWNMALDEALLEAADIDGLATLRFYGWRKPTLSLGYFQRAAERSVHVASRDCPLVRRASGGGAILHDAELTYSLALPTADRLAAAARGLHDSVHAALVEALAAMGIDVRIGAGSPAKQNEPFLCFQRHGAGDVLLGDAKIAGSAQRRHRGAILQHGSVLLARSRYAPELPGLAELTGRRLDPLELATVFRNRLGERLNLEWETSAAQSAIGDRLRTRAEMIVPAKFATAEWLNRR
ncbi:MAG TPA: lipoate--protein ligase family protein [Pirellulales bacterium]|jgi:lipoate-protein ligase A|nr:lipoate--protein ligase family protein [Pirellulales bacterium]